MEIGNFSWVIPGKLAGCSMPGLRENSIGDDIRLLSEQGIRVLVSLEHPGSAIADLCSSFGIEWIFFGIPDFDIPSDEVAFSTLVQTCTNAIIMEKPVCVHCRAGIGRTGLVLSCIVGVYFQLSGEMALAAVRQTRNAVESSEQHSFISTFLSDYEI